MRPDPQYGVQLSVADIPLELPIAPIYGVSPSNKYIPIQVDDNGVLSVGNVTISGPVTVTDVVIKGVDPANGNTSEDVSVVNLGGGTAYALRTSLYNGSNQLAINLDGSINTVLTVTPSVSVLNFPSPQSVTVVPSSTGVNLFATNNIPTNIETTLLTYTTTFPFHISQLIGWGTVDAEFLIYKNGILIGGGMSSPSNRTLNVDYEVAPISSNTGDIITVTISQFFGTTQVFRVNLLGE